METGSDAQECVTKTCTKCGLGKSRDEFYKSSRSKDGIHTRCKSCTKEYNNKTSKERSKKYRQTHPDRIVITRNNRRQQEAERMREWRKRNKDKVREQSLRRRPRQLAYYKEAARSISDAYIIHGFKGITQDLIPIKRARLKIHRAIKQQKKLIKEILNAK